MKNHATRRDRATVLFIVLSILGLLSTVGIVFIRTATVERGASKVRVEEVRARMAASGGLERAVAGIRRAARRPYDGPDSPWFYRGGPGRATGNGVALEDATAPSLAEAGLAHGRAYSGALPSTYGPLGDTFVLKVLDAASMIDLNAPIDPRLADGQQPLVRMLANLSLALDPARPALTPCEAEAVVAWRRSLPGGVFQDRRELLSVPGSPVTAEEFAVLADFVTTRAWADPVAVAPMDPAGVPAQGALVHGRVPTGAVLRLPRRPVSLNTAPVEVLTAVLAGIQAWYVDAAISRSAADPAVWTARGRSARTTPVSFDQARRLAAAIVARRESRPFASWADFDGFLAGQVAAGTIDGLQAEAIRANADPNVDTNRANPDAVVAKRIDKFDLVASTTEFGFGSGGVFEIESIGRVTEGGGKLRAEASVRATIEVFRMARHSTQAQFARGTFRPYTMVEPILHRPLSAIVTEQDLDVQGNPGVRGPAIGGAAGSIHANGDLSLGGSVDVAGDATASGTVRTTGRPSVGGRTAGGDARRMIPDLDPQDYRGLADLVFGASGEVSDPEGNVLASGSWQGFSFHAPSRTWSWSGGGQPAGILWFEGDLQIQSRTSGTWAATFVATGSISVRGTPDLGTSDRLGITLLAGTDVSAHGNAGTRIGGAVYAREQIELGGDADLFGPVLAAGRGAYGRDVVANRVRGSVVLYYDGNRATPYGLVATRLPSVASYPEADAWARIGGSMEHLPAMADADGWIGLAPVTISRAYLGPIPYSDRLLARWRTGSLDAEFAGGDPRMVADRDGPIVAPVVGSGAPGHLLADGCYSEDGAVGAFDAAGNVGSLAGTILFWIKPSWDAADTTRSHHFLSMNRADEAGTQSFQMARAGEWNGTWDATTGFHYERSTIENPLAERLVHSTWAPEGRRWTHVAVSYDFTEASGPRSIRVTVDGVEMPGSVYESMDTHALGLDELARAPISQANLVRLGERAALLAQGFPAASAEATFDEFLCLDEVADPAVIASIHGEGRYYSRGAADYLSDGLAEVAPGAEVLHATWTLRTPEGWTGPAPTLALEEAGRPIGSSASAEGFEVGRTVQGDLRYRVTFLAGAHAQPLYESPVVDDVTVAYAGAPRVLAWEE